MASEVVRFIIHTLPECIIWAIFILAVINRLEEWKKGIFIGLLIAVVTIIVRPLVGIGPHVFVMFLVIFVLFYFFFKPSIFAVIKGIAFKSLITAVIEVIVLTTLETIMGLPTENIADVESLSALAFQLGMVIISQIIVFGIIIVLISYYRKRQAEIGRIRNELGKQAILQNF